MVSGAKVLILSSSAASEGVVRVVQITEKDAKRASIVVRLLFEFIELLIATNDRAAALATM